jgi:chaperonin GroES
MVSMSADNRWKKLIIVGDRVLVKPSKPDERTNSGLYLPPGVQEKEKVQQGYVIKVGPGFPIPAVNDEEDSWKNTEKIKYVPLQIHEGDLVIYMVSGSTEVVYQGEKYMIVQQHSILMLEREEEL